MAEFIGNLDLRDYGDDEFVVMTSFSYKSSGVYSYMVPRGFITDLASIPRLMRPFFNRIGKSKKAAVLHDYMYCTLITGSRAKADRIFLEALKTCKVNFVQRWAMYLGVRAGGWIYWNKRSGMPINGDDFVSNDYWEN